MKHGEHAQPGGALPSTLPSTLASAKVWIDGLPLAPEAARVSVFDRGFLYGDSVFETLRTYERSPFALDEHMARLAESARRVYIDLPWSETELAREVQAACAESPYEECYVRLMVTRGIASLGLDPGEAIFPSRVLLLLPLKPLGSEVYEKGASVVTFQATRPTDATPAAGAKIGNYLTAVLASRKAREAHALEALISDHQGHVLEGATSNVFFCEAGRLVTPDLGAGILDGITRRHVLRIARELGVSVLEEVPTRARLLAADEIFISSSIRELVPIVEVDGHRVGAGTPGPLWRRLSGAFREHCRSAARTGA